MKSQTVMRNLAVVLVCAWLGLLTGGCESDNMPAAKLDNLTWLTDVPQAQAQARAENKLVMLEFLGSDWCPGCRQFHNEILATTEFANYAASNLVLVELDFPRKKSQPAALAKANAELHDKYEVKGVPTIILLDGNGNRLGTVEYEDGGVAHFIDQLNKLKKG